MATANCVSIDQNVQVKTTSKKSILEGAGVSKHTAEKEKEKSQKRENLKIESQDNVKNIPEKVIDSKTSKPFDEDEGEISKLHIVILKCYAKNHTYIGR